MNGNSSESLRDTLPTTKSAYTASASVSKATAWIFFAVRYLINDEYRSRTPAEAGQAEGLGSHRQRRRIPNPTLVGGEAPKPPLQHSANLNEREVIIIENEKEKNNSGGRVRDKKMSFWVSEAEQKKIKKLVAKTGLSQREYLLSAALGRTIYQVEELKPMLFELKAIGRNINQLTMLAHQGHVTTINLTEATSALQRNYAAINGLYDALDGAVASGSVEVNDDGDV